MPKAVYVTMNDRPEVTIEGEHTPRGPIVRLCVGGEEFGSFTAGEARRFAHRILEGVLSTSLLKGDLANGFAREILKVCDALADQALRSQETH